MSAGEQDRLHRFSAGAKKVLPAAIWQPLRAIATGLITPLRFATVTGHFRSSVAMAAHAADGTIIPWYTYPAIDFLAQRDMSHCNVMEFGGGHSSIWWGKHARSVLTFEENGQWLARVKPQVGSNVTLHHAPLDVPDPLGYVEGLIAAQPIRKFDVIVVDGHLRREAARLAFSYLAEGGALLFDNSEGYGFAEEAAQHECRRVDFYGFAPGVSMRACTSLVYVGDCFLLSNKYPITALERPAA